MFPIDHSKYNMLRTTNNENGKLNDESKIMKEQTSQHQPLTQFRFKTNNFQPSTITTNHTYLLMTLEFFTDLSLRSSEVNTKTGYSNDIY